ncbi:hypothetical protein MAR_016563, partial [Mya arenaria]
KLFNLVTNIVIENGNASVFSPMIPAPARPSSQTICTSRRKSHVSSSRIHNHLSLFQPARSSSHTICTSRRKSHASSSRIGNHLSLFQPARSSTRPPLHYHCRTESGGCCPISESSAESRHETSTRRLKSPANPKRWPRKTFYCININREKARITIQVQRLEMCLPLPRHRI